MSKIEKVLNQVGLGRIAKRPYETKNPFIYDADLNAWVRTEDPKGEEDFELLSDKDHEGFWLSW